MPGALTAASLGRRARARRARGSTRRRCSSPGSAWSASPRSRSPGSSSRDRRGWCATPGPAAGGRGRALPGADPSPRRARAAARRRAHRRGARASPWRSGRAGAASTSAEVRLERPRPAPAGPGAARDSRPARAARAGGRERRGGRAARPAADRAGDRRRQRRSAGGPSAIPGLDEGAAASRLDARAIELEVDGLRAYREGSPASRIHWPAVARTGELIERRLVAGGRRGAAGRPRRPSARRRAGARRGRARGRLALRPPRRRGGCAALLPGDRRPTEIEPDLRAWPHLHARFAVVEAGRRSRRRSAARCARERCSGSPPRRLAGAARRRCAPAAPGRATWSPRPACRRARPARAVFEVAGCVGTRRSARPRRTLAAGSVTGAALAGAAGRRLARAPSGRPRAAAADSRRRPRGSSSLVFAALGGFGARCSGRGWSTDAPAGRLAARARSRPARPRRCSRCSLAARLRRPVSSVVALAIAVAGVAGALLAIGIPGRLLLPANWGELRDGLSFGFSGVEQTELPYGGEDEWLRLALLCVAPATLRRRRRGRVLARPAASGGAGSWRSSCCWPPTGSRSRSTRPPRSCSGAWLLLVLAAGWLWAPRIASPRGAGAVAAVAAAGVLALPLASGLDPAKPVVGLRELELVRPRARGHASTGTTPTDRSTGRARARRCSRSTAPSRSTGRRACSTASTASPGSALATPTSTPSSEQRRAAADPRDRPRRAPPRAGSTR